ncbi:hypothetical protein AAD018_008845 [Aestuariibius insulae]|uniref:hypothetical protein n=1 Tax=Aestuariibius insulae TaxID=2058287 RepID=UPI00345EF97A
MTSPFDPDRSLTEAQKKADRPVHPAARIFVRGPWEMLASILIAVGVVMLMQPFFLWAYTYSFIVILTGTVMFLIVSHFPD